jgi:hypothetical protein
MVTMIYAVEDVPCDLTQSMSDKMPLYVVGLVGICLGFGLIGFLVGKAQQR